MGKSNKFDYTNRNNTGLKLGQIIGAALQKEAEKVLKDAERHLQKARKLSAVCIDGEIDRGRHVVDLKVPSKDLGDAGAIALADGLEAALKSGGALGHLALVDLSLSGNGLTTASLARLAPIIKLSECDLQTVDLTNNAIKVVTDEQAEQWEQFLQSFSRCFKLRRLDLSENTELGARALEIFARVHTLEPHINPLQPGGESSVLSLPSRVEDQEDTTKDDDGYTEHNGVTSRKSEGQLIKRRCGLRSIPYITLHDIGMNEAGTLWLSYVLRDHHYPNQLMDELNGTNAESLIKTYQQDTNSRGVDWTQNKTLSKEAIYLLEKTETFRHQAMVDDDAAMASSAMLKGYDSAAEAAPTTRRNSMDRRALRVGDRRFSIRSIRTDNGGEHELTELESARRKLQRHIIAHSGTKSTELWNAGLKVFRASRLLTYFAPTMGTYVRPSVFAPAITTVVTNIPATNPRSRTYSDGTQPIYPIVPIPAHLQAIQPTIKEVTDKLQILSENRRPAIRKDTLTEEECDEISTTEGLNTMTLKDKLTLPRRMLEYQGQRIQFEYKKAEMFRDDTRPGHLPVELMLYIVDLAVGEERTEVLTKRQYAAAWTRAFDRATLVAEREWLKKDESAQLWMLLESIECLTYGDEVERRNPDEQFR